MKSTMEKLIVARVPFKINEDGKWIPMYGHAEQWFNGKGKDMTIDNVLSNSMIFDEFALFDKFRGMILVIPNPEWCERKAEVFGLIEVTQKELTRMQETGAVEYYG